MRIYVCARVGLYVCLCMYMCVCVHSQTEIQGLTYCLVSEGYPRLQKFLAVYQGLKFWVQEQSALVYICNLSTGEVGAGKSAVQGYPGQDETQSLNKQASKNFGLEMIVWG